MLSAEKGEPGTPEWGAITGDLSDQTDLQTALDAKADVIISSASGSIASFADGSASPVTALSVSIEPVQAGTGDPSPTNIRPISGHTSATVTRTGKNVLDQSKCISKKYINASGAVSNSDNWCASDYTPIKGGQTYTFSGYTPAGWSAYHAFYNSNKTFISAEYAINHSTFTAPNNATYVRLSIYTETPTVAQLELSSSATPYEPYQAQQVTIDLDGTRYGGELNVLTGEMTVTKAIVDLGTLTWTYYVAANTGLFYADIADGKPNGTQNTSAYLDISSCYKKGSNVVVQAGDLTSSDSGKFYQNRLSSACRVLIVDTRYSDATTFQTAVTGQTLVYELATPLTVQLTPSQLSTLLGTNHIWADTGDTAVEYRADTKRYIDSKFSQLQALILEN
jgi:hypothetical protein